MNVIAYVLSRKIITAISDIHVVYINAMNGRYAAKIVGTLQRLLQIAMEIPDIRVYPNNCK